MEKNISKVRAHDAIVGMLYLISVAGSMFINANIIYLAIGVGFLQIISPFTKFCPVYFILNKMMPETQPFKTENKSFRLNNYKFIYLDLRLYEN